MKLELDKVYDAIVFNGVPTQVMPVAGNEREGWRIFYYRGETPIRGFVSSIDVSGERFVFNNFQERGVVSGPELADYQTKFDEARKK